MRVLVVDDSGVMRKIIARALKSLWIDEVVEAGDGDEALKKLEYYYDQIDLVLTDWNMPKMSGLDLVKAIRASGAKFPIMMITTETERGQVIKAIEAGITDYLLKPFDQQTLTAKLERILPSSKKA